MSHRYSRSTDIGSQNCRGQGNIENTCDGSKREGRIQRHHPGKLWDKGPKDWDSVQMFNRRGGLSSLKNGNPSGFGLSSRLRSARRRGGQRGRG
ncbi:hypothetical protein CHELA1G11_12120 [Hyphomicrobiales bacterium]|nr:hypothetical protein CHELA1G11_12120 [Hyphomicrobiales bacterium]CAH1663163.1 hypothetical protein CHELA1G2_12193 [Hyphomicrobiales bacterium]